MFWEYVQVSGNIYIWYLGTCMGIWARAWESGHLHGNLGTCMGIWARAWESNVAIDFLVPVKQVFTMMEFLGWYSIGDLPTQEDTHFHQQVSLFVCPLSG